MADENKQDFKKNFPGGFVWFLVGAFLLSIFAQYFMDNKQASVSFNYQLEHLVNQQLIQPEESRKTALNDNLVSFSGKFRERLSDEGKKRFKYLQLLNENHQLAQQKNGLLQEMSDFRSKMEAAGSFFLSISGTPVPETGYVIVDNFYTTPSRDMSVVVKGASSKKSVNLKELEQKLSTLSPSKDSLSIQKFGMELSDLINNYRSPLLGIGSERLKETLRELQLEVSKVNAPNVSDEERVSQYQKILVSLQGITDELNQPVQHLRLSALRSVRSYKEVLDQYTQISAKIEENEENLERARAQVANVVWFFNNQEISTRALEGKDPELYNHWFLNAEEEWKNFATNKGAYFRAPDQPLNRVLEKTFKSEEPTPNYLSYLVTLLPVFLVLSALYFMFARQMKGMGGNAMNFGKSPAKLFTKENNKITFKDVAGVDEAIEELEEVVDFLKNPQKFTSLGGRIPKGVLLVGPPGCGKTMIAKAVAGEADRPFFSISGSDFVEMFVGVGASRIRDMFENAKKNSPCIIFIDEIDAVGRHRGAGIGGGHDEREQTLNQLLVEMDGFDTNQGVILMAATNRPDVLDKALLRPGRFDRRVMISLPDIKGRLEILSVHAKKIKLDPSVDLSAIARSTPGASGADLENLLNEAALAAARKGRSAVTTAETTEARDKVLYGKERRSLEMDENEKRTTAYHESGHTIVGLVVKTGDPIDKVTIIPRGFSLGSTMFLPKKNRVSYWRKEILDQLAVLMGGRCAEEIFVDDVSSGAQQDIERATQFARSMVCEWGMSDKLGAVAYDERPENNFLDAQGGARFKYSEETAKAIDNEVRRLLDEAHKKAKEIILEKRDEVELMTQMLMEFETLDAEDVDKILNKKFDIEEKRTKMKAAEELHKTGGVQQPPPAPPEAFKTSLKKQQRSDQPA
jgi:cell division protease FtsH